MSRNGQGFGELQGLYLDGELELKLVTDVGRFGVLEGAWLSRSVSHGITKDV